MNINSIRNKKEALGEIITNNIDIFLVSETKINESFPDSQFKIEGYSRPYRLDRTDRGGGLLLYVRQDIPSKLIKKEENYEAMFVEINLKKQKWILSCTYNPDVKDINPFLDKLQISLDSLGNYDKLLLLGDFNCEIDRFNMPEFLSGRDLSSLIHEPTCFKNPLNPKCIDLILTSHPRSFQNSYSISNSLSDFHNITVSVLKTKFEKCPPKKIKYRCYRRFNENAFEQSITDILSSDRNFEEKMGDILTALNREAPIKTKLARGNDKPFMNKKLRKAIMLRSKLNNIRRKNPTDLNKFNYNQQRNRCLSILRGIKRNFFG